MVTQLRNTITSFVDLLAEELDAHRLEEILNGEEVPTGRDLGGYEPEAYIEDELIYPILRDALGLSRRRFPYSDDRTPRRPDFEIVDLEIIGENKVVNDHASAISDLKDRYLRDKGIEESFGIATDGFKWELIRIDTGGDFRKFDRVAEGDLRSVAKDYAISEGLVGGEPPDVDADERLSNFADDFSADGLEHHLDTAPQRFRDLLKGSIDEFYDLYVELLFGEGTSRDYETTLLDDIQAPSEAEPTEIEKRTFAITVVNRLLFIKLLEESGVLPTGFLADRVEEYRQSRERLAGVNNLYEDQIKPIFYDLFNTPRQERIPQHRQETSWFSDVPYLNGGLFRENVDAEGEYSIKDRIFPHLIYDLIEGYELEEQEGLDPSVLGNVFEMTINYFSGEEGRQKDIGAYYTPNDASELVAEQAVDEAIKDALVEVYSQYYPEVEDRKENFPLSKMLRWIEDQRSWFGDPEATEEAYERLGEVKILDPACGSGHFLTKAVTELHQAREALMRGMEWDEGEDWESQIYQAKEEIVTNAIYGVDIDPVAVEIAKLRVWLKIIEEGWEEGYGRLPNIDLNIVSGNSLVGLPSHSDSDGTLDLFRDRVDRIEELRKEYKYENENVRGEISGRMEDLKEELDKEYIRKIKTTHDFKVDIGTFEDASEPPLHVDEDKIDDKVLSLTFYKSGSDGFSNEEDDWLDERGFHTNPAWGPTARLDLRDSDTVTPNVVETIKQALSQGLRIKKIERYPVADDLKMIEGESFHWVASFPEVLDVNGGGGFDVIIGNPPYGNVLSNSESIFLSDYRIDRTDNIVFPFIERQLSLLKEGGSFGNVHSMGVLYQGGAAPVREMMREKLDGGKIACFGHRPATVFEGAKPRVAITTGQKSDEEGESEEDLSTSELILFYTDERNEAFQDIEYSSVEDIILGDYIGDDTGNIAYPKVGSDTSRGILKNLRDETDRTMGDAMEHLSQWSAGDIEDLNHIVYRNRHPLYWINPFLENLYPDHGNDPPDDFEPMEFDDELERRTAFILMQSSLFYHYWTTYENQRDLNWGPIEAFPFPKRTELEPHKGEIKRISEMMWGEMKSQFDGSEVPNGARLKPLADQTDNILDPLLGLNDDQIEWLKQYHTEFGRAEDSEESSSSVDAEIAASGGAGHE